VDFDDAASLRRAIELDGTVREEKLKLKNK
jgi:hypothetical protein